MLFTDKSWEVFDQLAVSLGNSLPSERFYNELDDIENFSEYYVHCKSFTHRKSRNAQSICAKVLKYLGTRENLRNNYYTYDVCLLLNYWVASRLSASVGYSDEDYVKDNFVKITTIWNTFVHEVLKKNSYETCNPVISDIVLKDWRLRKELYDYYVDYDYLKRMYIYNEKDKDYCTYFKNKVSLYNHFGRTCTSDPTNFCKEFKTKYKDCHPNKLLIDFKCDNEIEKKSLREEQTDRELHDGVSQGVTPENDTQFTRFSIDGKQSFKTLNTKINRIITLRMTGGVILGVAAISMICASLHKVNKKIINLSNFYIFFTPLGIWINKRFANKKYYRSNINSEFNDVYDYAQESHNPYYNFKDEHYIGYHSD
ncbi:variable surface protein [Plasmodium gonderi]|uniref:Variable surface protein n=1 Tax=Plasmodium gonderi TaxID=77519 RepID=A0A1Y1JU38_PLAGO|nr:variable surface protein [Plasmodium gonderi]GAW84252.1 variable surface protein [Plasmodium gonderi]